MIDTCYQYQEFLGSYSESGNSTILARMGVATGEDAMIYKKRNMHHHGWT
jgi:hypothetical protein